MIPGWGAKMPHASGPKVQNLKQKQQCNKFHKDFKNGPHPKKKKKYQSKPPSQQREFVSLKNLLHNLKLLSVNLKV